MVTSEIFTLSVRNLGFLIKGEPIEQCHYFEQQPWFSSPILMVDFHIDSPRNVQSAEQPGERYYKSCHHTSN
jgi:hypothetical protein